MKLRLALAAVAAAALTLPAAGSSAIVLNKSIAGITLGMTQFQVKAKLGDPIQVQQGRNEYGNWTIYTYGKPPVEITFQGEVKATGLETWDPTQRLANGIGVGSSLSQLQRKVHVRCQVGPFPRGLHCHTGSYKQGKLVTDFRIANAGSGSARVDRIFIGILVDCRVC